MNDKITTLQEFKDAYITNLNSALDVTLQYTHPNAPCMEDMGAISWLLVQMVEDLEKLEE